MKVQYQKEKVIDLDEGVLLNFTSTETKLLKIHIPETFANVDRVIIRAHLMRHSKPLNESFYFYVNNGNENPSPANHDFKGDEIWNVGKGVVIHNTTSSMLVPG
jgi:hypothetical protein